MAVQRSESAPATVQWCWSAAVVHRRLWMPFQRLPYLRAPTHLPKLLFPYVARLYCLLMTHVPSSDCAMLPFYNCVNHQPT